MKKLILSIAVVSIAISGCAQRSIDNLFKRYSDNEGYTSITINGDLLKIARIFDNDGDEKWSPEITQIRILAKNKDNHDDNNFYKKVKNEISSDNYEEFMSVKEKDKDLVMLVKAQGRNFREFLMVAGGDDNVLIQIKGKLTMKDAKKISVDFRHNHDLDLVSQEN